MPGLKSNHFANLQKQQFCDMWFNENEKNWDVDTTQVIKYACLLHYKQRLDTWSDLFFFIKKFSSREEYTFFKKNMVYQNVKK